MVSVAQSGVRWDGAVNAWHIVGSVYRMGRREWLTEVGWQQMYDDGVRTVIDLRTLREQQPRDTDPQVSPEVTSRFEIVHCPTEDPDSEEFTELFGPYLKDPAHYADYLRIFPDKLAAVFQAIAAAPGGVVIHCAAGRDRSGIIAVMLQNLAGVDDEEIVRGYQQGMRGINERHRNHPAPHAHDGFLEDEALERMLASRTASLLEFVGHLDTAAFLADNSLSVEQVAALRAKLAAPAVPVQPKPAARRRRTLRN
ncbi:tyrosine-protein phosphatase [Arthrobacter sp. GN70]|uniref:Protein-tyrosine-phosphatase n=2 Tax=Arthrobacter TaxID=1663 RepID=A0A4R5KF63_9MICC|nr:MULTISPECIES: tyrosine-protein phosphatase [Arthrobacter]MBT8162105.1 tyrosine-protein phosphatase [Arthrobacter sp. GN70]TDF93923.1 protein-tyrosine-phosphatase [Arthrobacter terricola]